MSLLGLALSLALSGPALALEAATLELRLGGKSRASFTLTELKAKLEPKKIRIYSRFSKKDKNYEAFKLQDILNLGYGNAWKGADYSDVAFIAVDGYEAVGGLSKLAEDGAYLAFRDLDRASGWEPVGDRKADPGPFFLVWAGKDQGTDHAYPWPWQIAAVNLIRFEDQYPAVVPVGAAANSPVSRGFTVFRGRCLRCHSMNLEGGKIGPDLNAPQSITAYRSKKMIKEFIRHPSKYRHTQMPDHPDLSDRDLEDLYSYFLFQSKNPSKTW